jgi:hypothetical protein
MMMKKRRRAQLISPQLMESALLRKNRVKMMMKLRARMKVK